MLEPAVFLIGAMYNAEDTVVLRIAPEAFITTVLVDWLDTPA